MQQTPVNRYLGRDMYFGVEVHRPRFNARARYHQELQQRESEEQQEEKKEGEMECARMNVSDNSRRTTMSTHGEEAREKEEEQVNNFSDDIDRQCRTGPPISHLLVSLPAPLPRNIHDTIDKRSCDYSNNNEGATANASHLLSQDDFRILKRASPILLAGSSGGNNGDNSEQMNSRHKRQRTEELQWAGRISLDEPILLSPIRNYGSTTNK